MSHSNDLERFGQQLRGYLRTVPREMGKAVVLESADNFRRQGYENDAGAVVPWAPRLVHDTLPGRKGKGGQRGPRRINPRQRAILVKTGRLRRSVRIVATTATTVTVGSSEPYAEVQQEGAGKRHPARPFITLGRSAKDKLTKKISAGITGLLK
ncbi:phage virion morphogenesis protein [Hymenobacter sp. BRD128]|uniref:phage virion morphogenesis protein n=1 Tax=Hymenobacter sp. BRD128 TaxID=2675878 RepID=UPI001565977E|nr:phage virion morphogenesis protein [Hymenobacter sp. BRD128]QKG56990.1 phage virion morphogenesis protein [Hymenobacter sp. BRD128]